MDQPESLIGCNDSQVIIAFYHLSQMKIGTVGYGRHCGGLAIILVLFIILYCLNTGGSMNSKN
ncbi:hypothetical protein C8P68_107240 [Mucilaginibacter yixingensis]|uniref:Uncharacterized protein n=1 Tax=Mucilaginibacter yixingensis TaxID=1295612 RepID=A0A2T5J6L6_9SPHI|nr:hypothetical protein C8P68_107240 [Mucilaginibacter yixingensis]